MYPVVSMQIRVLLAVAEFQRLKVSRFEILIFATPLPRHCFNLKRLVCLPNQCLPCNAALFRIIKPIFKIFFISP